VPDDPQAWSVADGFARATITTNALTSLTYDPLSNANVSVTTTFTIDAIAPPTMGQSRNVGIAHQHSPAANTANACVLNYDFNTRASTLWILSTMGAQTINEAEFSNIEAGTTYSIRTTDATSQNTALLECTAEQAPTQVSISGAKIVPESAGNRVSLRTRGTTTRFDYMFVVLGPPIPL
jgi:hypothetical protein